MLPEAEMGSNNLLKHYHTSRKPNKTYKSRVVVYTLSNLSFTVMSCQSCYPSDGYSVGQMCERRRITYSVKDLLLGEGFAYHSSNTREKHHVSDRDSRTALDGIMEVFANTPCTRPKIEPSLCH